MVSFQSELFPYIYNDNVSFFEILIENLVTVAYTYFSSKYFASLFLDTLT